MFGYPFYHDLIRKYVVIFGTLFNDISIYRTDEDGDTQQTMKVPLSYGPREKFLARLEEDPDLQRPISIQLPRIAFELQGISYDANRKLTTTTTYSNRKASLNKQTEYNKIYVPVPYNLVFRLSVMAKTTADGTKIIEQILPYFTPDWTLSVKLVEEMDNMILDIPVVLDGVQEEDIYESDFTSRRVIVWNLDFTVKGYFFGPTHKAKIIKVAKVNFHTDFTTDEFPLSTVVVQPGLTANGTPTSNSAASVPVADINESDNYGYVVTFEDHKENW